jgi:hypothetical protein
MRRKAVCTVAPLLLLRGSEVRAACGWIQWSHVVVNTDGKKTTDEWTPYALQRVLIAVNRLAANPPPASCAGV